MAQGQTLIIFTALDAEAPATVAATLDARNAHPCLDFDTAADPAEHTFFSGILPRAYDGGGLRVRLFWAMTSAIAGFVVWDIAIEAMAEGFDVTVDGFATAQTVLTETDSAAGIVYTALVEFNSGAEMDSLLAGEMFRLNITRDTVDAADTAAGDAELLGVEVMERPI